MQPQENYIHIKTGQIQGEVTMYLNLDQSSRNIRMETSNQIKVLISNPDSKQEVGLI